MNLQEQIMEQAEAINNVASSAYREGYKRGYEDAQKRIDSFLDNADKAYQEDKWEGEKEQAEIEGRKIRHED